MVGRYLARTDLPELVDVRESTEPPDSRGLIESQADGALRKAGAGFIGERQRGWWWAGGGEQSSKRKTRRPASHYGRSASKEKTRQTVPCWSSREEQGLKERRVASRRPPCRRQEMAPLALLATNEELGQQDRRDAAYRRASCPSVSLRAADGCRAVACEGIVVGDARAGCLSEPARNSSIRTLDGFGRACLVSRAGAPLPLRRVHAAEPSERPHPTCPSLNSPQARSKQLTPPGPARNHVV